MADIFEITGRIHSTSQEHVVVPADEIKDETQGKKQNVINADVAKHENDIHGDGGINDRLDVIEAAESITYGDENTGVTPNGSDFTNPDATKRAKVPTVGAILDGLNDGVYDVSKRNPTGGENSDGKFTLEYILTNADTLIPTSRRHGGMLISFVDSSDNKYLQYRLMLSSFTATQFANAANWQGVDDEPTAGSDNLVKSGGVYNKPIKPTDEYSPDYSNDVQELYLLKEYFSQNNEIEFKSYNNYLYCKYYPSTGFVVKIQIENNKDIYPLKVTSSTNQEVPINTIVGYVIFKDVTHFLANPTTNNFGNVIYEVATNITYSPVIDIYLRNGFIEKRMLEQDIIDAINNTDTPLVTSVSFPAREPYSETYSGYYAGYMLDLTGLYDKGYRGIVFRGATFKTSNTDIYAGIVYDENKGVLSKVRGTVNLTNDWFILPITSYAKYFYGTTCKAIAGGEIFTVSTVQLIDAKTYSTIANAVEKTAIVNDLTSGGVTKVLSAEQGKILNQNIFGINDLVLQTTINESSDNAGHPARINGEYSDSQYFRRYIVEVSSLYNIGYNKIRFFGFDYMPSWTIVAGLITTSTDINANYNVESYVPTAYKTSGYYELPITQESKYLIATVMTAAGISAIGSQYTMPEGIPLDYVPSTVTAFNDGKETLVGRIEVLEEQIENLPAEFPDSFLPKKIYGVIGDTIQIFKRGCVISQTPYAISCEFKCNQGKEYERYLEITPELASGSVPTGLTIKHTLIDDHYNKSEQKTSDLILANTPSSPASNINVLCIGASTTENGEWASELKRRLTGSGGTPTANGLTNITFVGRKEKTADGTTRPVDIKVEATGGWTWRTFYTPQDAVRLMVSGITAINIGDVYTYQNVSSQMVKVVVAEVNVTGDSGNIRFLYSYDTVGKGVPAAASGTISKVSGSGDATITYSSASEEAYCPFLDENNVGTKADFTNYASLYCNSQIDVAIFNLGSINEGMIGNANPTTVMEKMKIMLDGLHEDFPSCKVIIAPGMGFNTHCGLEYNFGADSNNRYWGALYGQFKYAKAVEDFISDNAYKDWCYLADTIAETDAENVFPITTKAVNTRVADKTEVIGTNGSHPLLSGYQMVADAIYRCFVNVIL